MLEILNARSDLSRRALVYELKGLSFREFLAVKENKIFPSYNLETLLLENENISSQIASQIKPLKYFHDYLHFGYYPYFIEGIDDYSERLNETINMILEVELLTGNFRTFLFQSILK